MGKLGHVTIYLSYRGNAESGGVGEKGLKLDLFFKTIVKFCIRKFAFKMTLKRDERIKRQIIFYMLENEDKNAIKKNKMACDADTLNKYMINYLLFIVV